MAAEMLNKELNPGEVLSSAQQHGFTKNGEMFSGKYIGHNHSNTFLIQSLSLESRGKSDHDNFDQTENVTHDVTDATMGCHEIRGTGSHCQKGWLF